MFDVTNWVACLNGEDGLRETLSISFSSQGALEIASFFHRRPFRLIYGASRIPQHDEGCRPSSLRPQHPNLYRHLKQRLGRSLRASSAKGLWSGRKKLHINVLELKTVSGLEKVQGPVSNQTVLVATDNSTVVAFNSEDLSQYDPGC